MSSLEDNYTKTLENILNLQKSEKELYRQLEVLSSTNTNTSAQNDIVSQIKYLSDTRIELIKGLAFNYKAVKQHTSNSEYDVIDQETVLNMVEDQLNKSKDYANSIENSNMNQMRMVEINSYYSKRYHHHTSLIKILIIVSVLVLIVILLKKYDIISQDVSDIIISIILFISVIVFVVKVYDLMKRNDMNYDEYDVKIPKPSNDGSSSSSSGNNNKSSSLSLPSLGCINGNCCSANMIYDPEQNKCKNITVEKFTTLENGCARCTDMRSDNMRSDNNMRSDYTPLSSVESTVIPFSHFSHYSASV